MKLIVNDEEFNIGNISSLKYDMWQRYTGKLCGYHNKICIHHNGCCTSPHLKYHVKGYLRLYGEAYPFFICDKFRCVVNVGDL